MKEKQKNICFRISEHTNTLLEIIAERKGYKSISEYAKHTITSSIFSDTKMKMGKIVIDRSKPIKKVSAYFYEHEIETLKRHCALTDMTLSREIALRVRQSLLKNSPCLYLNEIQQLKIFRNQINSIGRNIHFIISGDRYVTVNDAKFREEINEVLKMKSEIENLIGSLVDSAINRFN